jgi:GTP-binding protein HflX
MERVAIVGIRRPKQPAENFHSLMEELKRLIETAGGVVEQEFSQERARLDPGTLIGRGKIAEIQQQLSGSGIKTVVFDDDLTAAQQKNVEKMLKAKIVDRTRLILDIFAQRARTREGQLQIELAQLNYLVPRLTGSWRGYSQQMGGIGTRGPGEKKIEVERRYVRERIKRLKADIEDVRRHRERARLERKSVPLPQIALVGYTNVGKSTLLNALTGKAREVYADDKLFATLDPTTRRVKLPDGRAVLFTDTVGFIQKLPTELIAAFRATLEEVSQASLLLHVVDAAAPDYDEQEKTVLDVIKSLEADRLPILTAYNKSDKLTAAQQRLIAGKDRYVISSQTGSGLMELLKAIETKLDEVLTEVTFEIPHTKNALTALVYQTAHILEQQPTETGTRFHVRIDPGNWRKLSHDLGQ